MTSYDAKWRHLDTPERQNIENVTVLNMSGCEKVRAMNFFLFRRFRDLHHGDWKTFKLKLAAMLGITDNHSNPLYCKGEKEK